MAAYTRSILTPMVEALERSEARSHELEREVGRLMAERDSALEALRMTTIGEDHTAPQSPVEAPTAPQAVEPATEPSGFGRVRVFEAIVILALIAIVAAVVLLAWPR
jgi:hypothetical protein